MPQIHLSIFVYEFQLKTLLYRYALLLSHMVRLSGTYAAVHQFVYSSLAASNVLQCFAAAYSLAHQWRIKYCYFAKLRTPRFYGTLIALYSYFPQLRLFNFITTSEAFSIPSEHSTGDHIAHPPNRVNITYLLCFSDAFGTIRMRPSVPDPRTNQIISAAM
jgi:hypothetical protein